MPYAKIKIDKESKKHKAWSKFGNNKGTPPTLEVPLNPKEYSRTKKANYATSKGKSSEKKETQFIDSDAEEISVDLFFDVSKAPEKATDVRKYYTDHLDLLVSAKDPKQKAPPIVNFEWGSFTFRSVVNKVDKTFTRFDPTGTPTRAKVNMTFKKYGKPTKKQAKSGGGGKSGKTKTVTVKKGDTLWDIANSEYGDPTQWGLIAAENDISDPRSIPVGTKLTIPPA